MMLLLAIVGTKADVIPSSYYSEPAAGTYYLYNVTQQQFLTGSPSMSSTPVALTLAVVDETKYTISPATNQYLKMGKSGNQYLWSNGWADNGFFKWTFSSDGKKTYNLNITATANADNYFTNGITYYFNTVNTAPSTSADEADEWTLITEANYYSYVASTTATIPASFYTTTPVAGNTYYLYSPYSSCFLYATSDRAGFQNTPAEVTLTANGDDFNIQFSNGKYLKYDAVKQGNTWANGNVGEAWAFSSFHGATGLYFIKHVTADSYLYARNTSANAWGGECWGTPETNNTRYGWALISESDYTAWQNSFVLDEATGYAATMDVYNVNPTVNRAMTANVWNTLVVPFDMAIPSGWTVKEPTAFDDGVLTFGDASSIVAGKPYIVKPDAAVASFSATGVTLKKDLNPTTVGDLTMTGTYTKMDAVPTDSYVIGVKDGASALYKVNSTVSLKPFRAYFTVADPNSTRIALNFDGETTGVDDAMRLNDKGQRINGKVYDLQGRSVKNPAKGLYIKNGKKVAIK